jgi:hypothetical protein
MRSIGKVVCTKETIKYVVQGRRITHLIQILDWKDGFHPSWHKGIWEVFVL